MLSVDGALIALTAVDGFGDLPPVVSAAVSAKSAAAPTRMKERILSEFLVVRVMFGDEAIVW